MLLGAVPIACAKKALPSLTPPLPPLHIILLQFRNQDRGHDHGNVQPREETFFIRLHGGAGAGSSKGAIWRPAERAIRRGKRRRSKEPRRDRQTENDQEKNGFIQYTAPAKVERVSRPARLYIVS